MSTPAERLYDQLLPLIMAGPDGHALKPKAVAILENALKGEIGDSLDDLILKMGKLDGRWRYISNECSIFTSMPEQALAAIMDLREKNLRLTIEVEGWRNVDALRNMEPPAPDIVERAVHEIELLQAKVVVLSAERDMEQKARRCAIDELTRATQVMESLAADNSVDPSVNDDAILGFQGKADEYKRRKMFAEITAKKLRRTLKDLPNG